MMKYHKLFIELKKHDLCPSALIRLGVLSAPTLERLKKDRNISLFTLDLLCRYLNCSLEDIASSDDCLSETENDTADSLSLSAVPHI